MYLNGAGDDLYQKVERGLKEYFLVCVLLEQTRYERRRGLTSIKLFRSHLKATTFIPFFS